MHPQMSFFVFVFFVFVLEPSGHKIKMLCSLTKSVTCVIQSQIDESTRLNKDTEEDTNDSQI